MFGRSWRGSTLCLPVSETAEVNNAMPYGAKIVLRCISAPPPGLGDLIEAFVCDGVKFVGVVGPNAAHVEELIDQLVVGDGTSDARFILTSSHEGESLQDAVEFAKSLTGEYAGEVQIVDL
jgi:hypothetical protein